MTATFFEIFTFRIVERQVMIIFLFLDRCEHSEDFSSLFHHEILAKYPVRQTQTVDDTNITFCICVKLIVISYVVSFG